MIEFIITIISLLLGYAMGREMLNKENLDKAIKEGKGLFQDKYVGTVKRPSATQLLRKTNPDLADEEDEMKRDLGRLQNE